MASRSAARFIRSRVCWSSRQAAVNLFRPASTLRSGTDLLLDYVEELWNPEAVAKKNIKTVEIASPVELEAAFREKGCGLALDGKPMSEEVVLEACKLAMKYSVKSNHPLFWNQLYGRVEPIGLLGSYVTATTAGNCHTFEVAPVYTMTENAVIKKLLEVAGYPEDGDGLFVPGGSISNMYGMHLARFRAFPQVKTEGLSSCPTLVAFTSTHSHYSYAKAAHTLGIGTSNMVEVKTNRAGQMCPEALEAAVQKALSEGKKPFFVGATEGSTVTGAFDDLRALRQVCDKHGMWLHADCCWGGPAMHSSIPEVRNLIAGIESTDSYAWNPHKFMGTPIQCSPFLVRYPNILKECNGYGAAYLFQPDKKNTEYDVGDKTIQCGRLPDSFKLWLQWKHVGDQGWTDRIDYGIKLTNHMTHLMSAAEAGRFKGRFQLVIPSCFTNVCFWYFPPSLEAFDPHGSVPGEEKREKLHQVARLIKSCMQEEGKALIGFQSIRLEGEVPLPNFFRMVFSSPWTVTEKDVEQTLLDIDRIGSQLDL
eukprot:TRINITY_DN66473_c0_g1_i1.p1 TRINITY_DN66473_c0_g1~~TRINITY_DN66473_c0_g1_i1.p1  ORF type:complete len:535 (+),score=88.60 TRINITY_DN66473_c0_g1_i1:37-1641(+)